LTDAVLNKRHDEMQWHPYWAQAWDAWRGVADRLTELPLAGLSVLDLGCGLGMTGAVAAACGAKVTMGDNAVPSLQFARLNSWPWRERAQIKLIDWNHDTLGGKFDLIVGCDIVYERQQVEPLDRFFRNHLAARSGKSTQHAAGMVLLGDPTRIMTRDFLNRFAQLGWHQSESSRRYPGIDNPIRLVEMRLELD
jgi:predicted nicotinamide N-methyase